VGKYARSATENIRWDRVAFIILTPMRVAGVKLLSASVCV